MDILENKCSHFLFLYWLLSWPAATVEKARRSPCETYTRKERVDNFHDSSAHIATSRIFRATPEHDTSCQHSTHPFAHGFYAIGRQLRLARRSSEAGDWWGNFDVIERPLARQATRYNYAVFWRWREQLSESSGIGQAGRQAFWVERCPWVT